MTNTMGIDQYGEHYDALGKYPRKELLKRFDYTNASKMYIDKKDGSTVHCGYIIGRHWISLFEVKPREVKA